MKKLLSVLLLISIILSMSACLKDKDDEVPTEVPQNTVLDEYHAYTASNTLPEGFIGYNKVSELGELNDFFIGKTTENYWFSNRLCLQINHSEIFYGTVSEHPMDRSDMLSISNPELKNAKTQAEEIYYHYDDGRLSSIEWYSQGKFFILSVGREYALSEDEDYKKNFNPFVLCYDDTDTDILSKFLNTETVPIAIAAFDEMLYGTQQP